MAGVARESFISEVEVVFTRVPSVRPPMPTSPIPQEVLDEAIRLAQPTVEVDAFVELVDEEEGEEDETETDTWPLRDAFGEPASTEPLIAAAAPWGGAGGTVPLTRDVVAEAERLAEVMRELRQPPPTWPPPAPASWPPSPSAATWQTTPPASWPPPPRFVTERPRAAQGGGGISALVAVAVAAASLAAGAATLVYALAL